MTDEPLAELTDIATIRDIETPVGILPSGTLGEIVMVLHAEHQVYLVEFAAPWEVQQINRADMIEVQQMQEIDWSACPLVVRDPSFHGGVPALRDHPRLPVEALVHNFLDGETIEDVAFMFAIDVELTRQIIQYYVERTR
jgi:uncharacterized protein (DUF433 family)